MSGTAGQGLLTRHLLAVGTTSSDNQPPPTPRTPCHSRPHPTHYTTPGSRYRQEKGAGECSPGAHTARHTISS